MALSSGESTTRALLIDATARRLWAEDESELRILDICQETNLSTSVIYGHFRSRQGLVDAAMLANFKVVAGEIRGDFAEAAERCASGASYLDALQSVLSDPQRQEAQKRQRQMFLRASAATLARPSMRAGFLALYHEHLELAEALFDTLIGRGQLPERLTGRQWAILFEALMLARAPRDLTPEWTTGEDWVSVVRALLSERDALDPL